MQKGMVAQLVHWSLRFVAGSLLTCVLVRDGSSQKMTFIDASGIAGIALPKGAHGVAVTDFDQNGTADIFFAANGGTSSLFSGHGDGTFTDVTSDARIAIPGDAAAPVWADVNNDGFADLFVGIRAGNASNRLFLNRGDATFSDVLSDSGIDPDARIGSATFGDFDRDGLVDLFLATRDGPDLLYRNTGEFTFDDVSEKFGVQGLEGSVAMQSSWFDYDDDGDVDLLVVHDGTYPNRLYRNNDGQSFSEVASEAGLADTGSGNGMGLTWLDVDLDGKTDLYVTRISTASLYHNRGNDRFEDMAEPFGVMENGMSWGVVSEDFDNDADPDLFVVNTFSFDRTSETFLYENHGGSFSNVAENAHAVLKLDAFGVASADFDRDGLVDLVITSNSGDNRLLLNRTVDAGNWISVNLTGTSSNRMAIGARIRVISGGRVHENTVFAGDSYCSQSSSSLHVGVGDSESIDAIEILWPGRDSVDRFEHLEVNKSYQIIQDSGISTASETDVPRETKLTLAAAYPNPFSEMTSIQIDLPDPTRAVVSVFDLLGRRIIVIDEREAPAGRYTIAWDGLDASGRNTAPGTYVIRLDAGGRSLVRSIVKIY